MKPQTRSVFDRPPARIYKIAVALLVWLIVPWWLFLGTTAVGAVVFAVCVIFTLIAFGVAGICVVQALRTRGEATEKAPPSASNPAHEERFRIETGTLPVAAAAIQILLIPGAVALGFTALALTAVIVGS